MNRISIASVFILAILSETKGIKCYECVTVVPNYIDQPENSCGKIENGKDVTKVVDCSWSVFAKVCATHTFVLHDRTVTKKACLNVEYESKCNTTSGDAALNCCYGDLCNVYDKSISKSHALRLYNQSILLLIVFIIFLADKLCDIGSFLS